MSQSSVSCLLLTAGEAGGINQEIAHKAHTAWRMKGGMPFVICGDPVDWPDTLVITNIVDAPRAYAAGHLPLFSTARATPTRTIMAALTTAMDFIQSGQASAMVTLPIIKERMLAGGFTFPGHTEFLADYLGVTDYAMMLVSPTLGLRVVPATIHIPLSQVAANLNTDTLIRLGKLIHRSLKQWGIDKPRLALAALNPHAGEGGRIGKEEQTIIIPAFTALRQAGLDITRPLPSDTLFHTEARANYDAVLCMYHDQALIPLKTLDFWGGVNVTLGLPIIRTSPDHGAGLDIVGQGIAKCDSLLAAMQLSVDMSQR
jgi:4-hydroxythreonine-4-phosphate dehydrogenase